MSLLHCDTDSIEEYFVAKMHERLPPTRVTKITNHIKRERNGSLRHKSYKERGEGKTEQWKVTKKLFSFHAERLGFNQLPAATEPEAESVVAAMPMQQKLF
jgi:hypothetical protein